MPRPGSQYDIRIMQCNDVMLKCRDIDLVSILVEHLSNSFEQLHSYLWNKTVLYTACNCVVYINISLTQFVCYQMGMVCILST